MRNSSNFKAEDENPQYWQERQRDAKVLDRHWQLRSQGGNPLAEMNKSAYVIPNHQKVRLKESAIGGLPEFQGRVQDISRNYAMAQTKLASQDPSKFIPTNQNTQGSPVQELDGNALLFQRMLSNGTNTQNVTSPQQLNIPQQPTSQVCQLTEGYSFYTALNTGGFGIQTQLVKKGGQINQGFTGKQFQLEGVVQCYWIDGLPSPINLQTPEPTRMLNLVKVTLPMQGSFLVPQEAIIREGGIQQGGRQLLVDQAREQIRQQAQRTPVYVQPQPSTMNPPGRQILTNQNVGRPVINQPLPQQRQPGVMVDQRQTLQQQSANLLRNRGLLKG